MRLGEWAGACTGNLGAVSRIITLRHYTADGGVAVNDGRDSRCITASLKQRAECLLKCAHDEFCFVDIRAQPPSSTSSTSSSSSSSSLSSGPPFALQQVYTRLCDLVDGTCGVNIVARLIAAPRSAALDPYDVLDSREQRSGQKRRRLANGNPGVGSRGRGEGICGRGDHAWLLVTDDVDAQISVHFSEYCYFVRLCMFQAFKFTM